MFYGWYIVGAGVILSAYNAGALTYGFTAFIDPIADTFGWSYAQISLAVSLRGAETGALSPLLGVLVDRWPSKRLVLGGIILLGLGLYWLSRANSLAMFYLAFLVIALGNSLAVQMVPTAAVARWFRKDIGKASGVLAMGIGIGGVLLPLLVKVIDAYGWQETLVILAVGAWGVGIPLSFFFRDRPEKYGLLPDGKQQNDSKSSAGLRVYDFGTGVKEALKMRAFWSIGIATMLQMATMQAVTVHMMPYLTSLGIARSTAGMVAMLVPLISLTSRIPFGLLTDIWDKRYVMAFSIGLLSVGAFLFWLIDGSSFLIIVLFAITFGVGMGGFVSVRPPVVREYFGTKNFATIFGLLSVFATIGMVASPPVAGWVFDTLGFYDPIWLIMSIIAMIGTLIMLTSPLAPQRLAPTMGQIGSAGET